MRRLIRGFPLLVLAAFSCWPASLAAAGGRGPIREAKDLYLLTREEAASGLPVEIRGVITYCRGPEFPEFVMQDGTAGFIARLPPDAGSPLSPGDVVGIKGVTTLGEGLPTRVAVSQFTKAGTAPMPPPLSVSPATIARGGGRYSFVEFTGVIRGAAVDTTLQPPRLVLRFSDPENPLLVRLTGFDDDDVARLVPDTRVAIRGVALAWTTPSLQPLGGFVVVQAPSDINILSPARALENQPVTPLATLLSSPTDPFEVRRRRTSGTATLVWPDGQVVIQEGDSAIRLSAPGVPAIGPGDQVEISGFPGSAKGRVTLHEISIVRKIAVGVPAPEVVGARRIVSESLKSDRDARRIRVTARLLSTGTGNGHPELRLESEGVGFQAILPAASGLPRHLEPGMELAVTGTCRILYGPPGTLEVSGAQQFEIHVQDARDIAVISAAPWWTERRLNRISLAVLGVFITLCLAWVAILHRKTRLQKKLLREESRALEDSRLLAAERSRLAADLHDTLSQTLSGASLQLEATDSADPAEAAENLALARMLLDRGREELRRAVWDLTPADVVGSTLEAALRSTAAEWAAYHDCEILISAAADLPEVDERTRSHLFRIGQEAIHNAVRHGGAENIRVGITRGRTDLSIRITDDGRGFNPATAPGPIHGHFGLSSMRDRAARLGGTLEIRSSPAGTEVTATVPLSPSQPA